MRIDVAAREVGSFFGGREQSARSQLCPKCGKPGLVIKTLNRGPKRTQYIAHGFALELAEDNDSKVEWDEPCIVRTSAEG